MVKMFAGVFAVVLSAGCTVPSLIQIDALDGEDLVASLSPGDVTETVFDVDLPTDVLFELTFDETIALPSARENLWIEDQEGQPYNIEIEARLQTLSILPGSLAPGENHTVVIMDDLEDNNGTERLFGYRIAFFTEPEGD